MPMQSFNFGDKLQILRRDLNLTQKEFSELLEIPQPSISAYENGRNSPTLEVLVTIAQKCNISLDWLCGLSSSKNNISTLADIAKFLYDLVELNEIGGEIEVYDRLPGDLETEIEKWYTKVTFYGNDPDHEYNADLCNILRQIKDNYEDLISYSVSKEMYDLAKEKIIEYYSKAPLTQKKFEELSREERIKKHIEYLNSL